MASHHAERHERLWVPVTAPVIWAIHFMLCYVTAALSCGRFASAGGLPGLQGLIAIYTTVAVAGMTMLFVHGFRRHQYRLPDRPHDDDTPEDRHHFLAFTTMLLAGLSIVASAFVAIAVVIVNRCP